MTPHPSSASSSGSMDVESGHPASTNVRLVDIIASFRRLATKFLQNPRWGVMFTLGKGIKDFKKGINAPEDDSPEVHAVAVEKRL